MKTEKVSTEVTTSNLSIEDLMKESSTGPLPLREKDEEPVKKPETSEKKETEEGVDNIKTEDKEEEEPKKEVKVKEPEVVEDTPLSLKLKETITLMYGEDFLNETAVGGEDDNVMLSDIDITPEIFKDIVQTMTEERVEKATEGTVSIKGADGQFKDLLEIAKNGGDVQELIRVKVEIEDQVNGLDLDNKADQQSVIVMAKKMEGLSDKDVSIYMRGVGEENLYDIAVDSKERILNAVTRYREDEKRRAQEEVDRKKELTKLFKKELSKSISETLDVNEKYKKKLVDIATKADEDGVIELDRLYNSLKHDPKQAPELILFLTDREEFKKQISSKEVLESKKSSIRLIRKAAESRSSNIEESTRRRGDEDRNTIPLDSLKISN